MVVAAISGLADVDALTLSVANMGAVSAAGIQAVLLCLGVNTVAKSIYGWMAGGSRLGLRLLAFNVAAMVVAVASYLLVPSLHL
jgi:uncharacterized membrane protein (DUF4010 family)